MIRMFSRLAVIVVGMLVVDGCFYRDPGVELEHGYGIMAISPGSPCHLCYNPMKDRRSYSDWTALRIHAIREGQSSVVYTLMNSLTGEMLEYDSVAAWQKAMIEKDAAPGILGLDEVVGITGFQKRGDIVFGTTQANGHFILDMGDNMLRVFGDQDKWQQEVLQVTAERPGKLTNPKSFWHQARHPVYYGIMGAFFLATLPWVIAPLRFKREENMA